MKKYQLNSNGWLLSDIKGVRFHVRSSDYFGTLASVLTIIKEKISHCYNLTDKKLIEEILKNTISDCLYLQKNYSIIPKNKNKSHKPKGIDKIK